MEVRIEENCFSLVYIFRNSNTISNDYSNQCLEEKLVLEIDFSKIAQVIEVSQSNVHKAEKEW